jgi:hypothetical protein
MLHGSFSQERVDMSDTARMAAAIALSMAASFPAMAQESEPGRPASGPDAPVVVFEFTATDVAAEGDLIASVLEMAAAPQVSRLVASDPSADAARVEGALVFDGLDAFSRWRETEMDAFLQPVGGMAGLETTVRVFRAGLLAKGYPREAGGGLGDVSITYRNSGNKAAGDADIDAVTVICPGDDADCKPSN